MKLTFILLLILFICGCSFYCIEVDVADMQHKDNRLIIPFDIVEVREEFTK